MNGEAIRDIKEIFKALPSFFKVVFIISWVFTICLFLAGACIPPYGVIDGSLLTAGGIIMGFVALMMAFLLVLVGRTAKFEHGDTKLTIGGEDGNN